MTNNNNNKIFKNRDALNSKWIPPKDIILYRDLQIEELSPNYDCILDGTPENYIIYGKPGTGKTLVNRLLKKEIEKLIDDPLKSQVIYLKCDRLSEFQALVKISNILGSKYRGTRANYYEIIEDLIGRMGTKLIIILDEAEKLVKKYGDTILFELSRMNEEFFSKNSKGRVGVILITNDLTFIDYLHGPTRSSLGLRTLTFPPYNAIEIKDILKKRAELGFNNGILEEGVIEKCAALSAQEHGDARRALDLLKYAGELAARKKAKKVTIKHVDEAEDKIDIDAMTESMKAQPKQSQLVLYSIFQLVDKLKETRTGDVYDKYCDVVKDAGLRPLTQRRVSDLIKELDDYGVINAKSISKGRYGVSRIIDIGFSNRLKQKIEGILIELLGF